jgi:hypothetical protein
MCKCKKYIFREADTWTVACPECKHGRYHCNKKPQGTYFEYFPLGSALKMCWAHWKSWAAASYYPWEGHVAVEDAMTDLYDSPNWKKHPELEVAGNMGVVLNADGMSVFQTGSYSTWPLYLINANLPPHLRYELYNMIATELIGVVAHAGVHVSTCTNLFSYLQN